MGMIFGSIFNEKNPEKKIHKKLIGRCSNFFPHASLGIMLHISEQGGRFFNFFSASAEIITFAEYLLNLVFNSFVVTLAINIPHVR